MKAIARKDGNGLLFEAARLCYELDISQREAAEALGVSPATITRLLRKARNLGIVRIVVQRPEQYETEISELTGFVKDALGLDEAVIVGASCHQGYIRKEMAQAAATWLLSLISAGMNLGFSGGRSVSELVEALRRFSVKDARDTQVVQLMGGISSTQKDIQADVVARGAAVALGSTCYVIHGPAILPDAAALSQLLRNRAVSDIVERFNTLDVAIVGIGTLSPSSPLVESGCLAADEIARLQDLGAVGEICGRFFNKAGNECDSALSKRTLAIGISQLMHTPRVCALAAGTDKVPAIVAACSASVVKTLITDVETARVIMQSVK